MNDNPAFAHRLLLSVLCIVFLLRAGDSVLPDVKIDEMSKRSLYLNIYRNDVRTGRATGFLVKWKGKPYLITNWHVVTGHHPLHPTYYAEMHKPDSLKIIHHSTRLGIWINKGAERIYNEDGSPRYHEHPDKWVDVVALPVQNYDTVVYKLYFLDISHLKKQAKPVIGMPVFIIGFVEGLTGSGVFPIWKAGHIASEPLLKYQGNNAFLIDATTRGGMSGSPVVYRSQSSGAGKVETSFLGIYAGRLSEDSEIGLVWTPENIIEVLEAMP